MFKVNPDGMRMEPTPERVLSVCRLVSHKSMSRDEVRQCMTLGINDEKDFYAFDYNTYQWFYLGKISASGLTDAILVTQGQFNNETLADVATGGLVFKIVNTSGLQTAAMPKFWDKSYTSWQ